MRVAVLLGALLVPACQLPYRHSVWVSAPVAQDGVDAGSELRVRQREPVIVNTRDGQTRLFQIASLDRRGINVVSNDGGRQRLEYADIERLFVKRMVDGPRPEKAPW